MRNILVMMLVTLLLPVLSFAQNDRSWQEVQLEDASQPLASIDNLFIPYINPSLLATGHGGGFGFANVYDDMKLRDHYWITANMDGLSYLYEYSKNALNQSVNHHTLATGFDLLPANILPNVYAGTSYRWKNNKFGKGDFRSAITYRPHSSASLAFRWDNGFKESPSYAAGLALRPLSWLGMDAEHRFELSGDIDYSKQAGEYELSNPVVGINTQILQGLKLGANYNLDTESAMLSFSLSMGKTELGSIVQMKDNDNYAIPYIHFTDDTFSPFMGISSDKWYKMNLTGSMVSYKSAKYSFGPIKVFDKETKSIESVIAELKKAKADPNIQGIVLRNPSFSTSLALSQELIAAMQDFKCSGKKIACYYDNISNGGYIFAASVADDIYLNPMGSVDIRGLSITSPYFKELLDTIGVDVINFRSHKYKSAGNQFSEAEMTEAEREVYNSLLQSFFDQIVASINAGRGSKLKGSVTDIIDAGPYMIAKDALDAGLVDNLIFEDELQDNLKDQHSFSAQTSELPDYRDYSWAKPKQNLIAVIYAQGNIVMGKGAAGQKIAHQTTVDLIRAARKNKDYKGIILRVDSGGGSAQASDIILRELELAQSENKKPVVVSMAGVAGSGGYYIACGADRIIADPATITGSIGVIGLVFNMPKLYDKLKVNWSTVKKGENSDFGSTSRAWTNEEKMRMESVIETIYEDFVGKVDAGRENLSLDEVHKIAQGRVWTGEQALANGLIDDLGGMETAIEHMRELTGITGNITLVDATTGEEGFSIEMDGSPLSFLPEMKMLEGISADYKALYELWNDYQDESTLMMTPLVTEPIQF